MKERILIISEYFYPSDNSTSYYITEIAKALASIVEVKVLCNTALKGAPELDGFEHVTARLDCGGYNKNKLVSRIVYFMRSTFKLGWKTLFAVERGGQVFAVTNPAFLIIMLAVIKKIKPFNLTLLAYDIFPENVLAAGMIQKKSITYKIVAPIFDWAYQQADRIVVIGRDMEEVVGRKTRYQVPMRLITNWCDYERIELSAKRDNAIIQKLHIEEKVVFSFIGNFGRVQGIQNLLDAASLVKSPSFVLLFIGDGAMRPVIDAHINKNSNGNVMYGGSFPSSEENVFLNACDVALVSLDASMYGLGVPSKSYYNMAAGKPILFIGDTKSEIGRVIHDYDVGWVCPPNEPQILARLFDKVCLNMQFKEKGSAAAEVVKKYYAKDVVLNKYKALYAEVEQ